MNPGQTTAHCLCSPLESEVFAASSSLASAPAMARFARDQVESYNLGNTAGGSHLVFLTAFESRNASMPVRESLNLAAGAHNVWFCHVLFQNFYPLQLVRALYSDLLMKVREVPFATNGFSTEDASLSKRGSGSKTNVSTMLS